MTTETTNRFANPHPVTGLEIVFSGDTDKLLPRMDEIPEEFKRRSNKWVEVVSTWFFAGLKNDKWTPKPGIDQQAALAHIKACIGSLKPDHEHKRAGCAYLLSLWFDDVTYERAREW